MKRREFITLLGGAVAAWPVTAWAQSDRTRRIGMLMGYPEGDPHAQANVKAMQQGLQSLGWIDGKNVTIDYRWAGGDPEKARAFAKGIGRPGAGRDRAQHQPGDGNPAAGNQ
jgi:putative ABC transport system substrate-binding protein